LSVNTIVPGRDVVPPVAELTLVNLTFTVQVAPGAKVVPVHVSDPGVTKLDSALKNQVKRPEPAPEFTATLLTVTDAPPAAAVLRNVTVPIPVPKLPVGVATVINSGFGVMDTLAGATPVPDSATGDPVTGTLAAIDNVAGTETNAVGANTTLIVQLEAEAKVAPQVPPAPPAGREYRGDEKVKPMPVRVAPPVFWSVTVCAALFEPVATFPKASVVGVTFATAGPAVPVNSTAPTSTELLAFLSVPKKSSDGAAWYVVFELPGVM